MGKQMTEAEFDKLKNLIKSKIQTDPKYYSYFLVGKNSKDFLWVQTSDSEIGNQVCHYEIRYDGKNENNTDSVYVEIHVESHNPMIYEPLTKILNGLNLKSISSRQQPNFYFWYHHQNFTPVTNISESTAEDVLNELIKLYAEIDGSELKKILNAQLGSL